MLRKIYIRLPYMHDIPAFMVFYCIQFFFFINMQYISTGYTKRISLVIACSKDLWEKYNVILKFLIL